MLKITSLLSEGCQVLWGVVMSCAAFREIACSLAPPCRHAGQSECLRVLQFFKLLHACSEVMPPRCWPVNMSGLCLVCFCRVELLRCQESSSVSAGICWALCFNCLLRTWMALQQRQLISLGLFSFLQWEENVQAQQSSGGNA